MFQKSDNYGFSKKNDNIIKFVNDNDNGKSSYIKDDNMIFAKVAMEYLKKNEDQYEPDEFVEKFVEMYDKFKSCSKTKRNIPEQTVFDDYIICLEDGKKMKMLKRHLRVHYGMTFGEYKAKWNLPVDYPCTCKNYSKVRASIAERRNKKKKDINN